MHFFFVSTGIRSSKGLAYTLKEDLPVGREFMPNLARWAEKMEGVS